METLAKHAASFDCADTPLLTAESVASVLQMVDTVFPFSEKIISDDSIEIMLIEAQHEYRNGESTAIFTPDGMQGSICIYQMQADCTARPEHILLHELGHLLHIKATGTLTEVPPSFIEYLSQLGTDCSKLSKEQLREIFADTFMLALLSKHPELGIPIPGISHQALDVCYKHLHTLFDELC